jgi:hypothetical protein
MSFSWTRPRVLADLDAVRRIRASEARSRTSAAPIASSSSSSSPSAIDIVLAIRAREREASAAKAAAAAIIAEVACAAEAAPPPSPAEPTIEDDDPTMMEVGGVSGEVDEAFGSDDEDWAFGIAYSSKPLPGTSRLAERGRRLLNWRKPEADATDAAQMAVDLAVSREHAESMVARLGGFDGMKLQNEVKQLKEKVGQMRS